MWLEMTLDVGNGYCRIARDIQVGGGVLHINFPTALDTANITTTQSATSVTTQDALTLLTCTMAQQLIMQETSHMSP